MSMSPEEIFAEQFRSAGVLPTGPISPYPRDREIRSMASFTNRTADKKRDRPMKPGRVKATAGEMLTGAIKTAGQAIKNGSVDPDVRAERLETCYNCPHFIEDSKRCSLCGCFMKAKSWVNGNPNTLCPAKKWVR